MNYALLTAESRHDRPIHARFPSEGARIENILRIVQGQRATNHYDFLS
jgi:hypothetical protein